MPFYFPTKNKICLNNDCFYSSNTAPIFSNIEVDIDEECRNRCTTENGSYAYYYELDQVNNNLKCFCDRTKKHIENSVVLYICFGIGILIILMLLFGNSNNTQK